MGERSGSEVLCWLLTWLLPTNVLFKDWAKRTQLHVGFLMHLHGNVQSAQYFQDLIKQLLEANGKQSGRFYLAKIYS